MKPNFALRLAHDSIELLQRSSDGWLSVGATRLDDPDLDATLGQLREQAARLAPEGITTKLIIPDTELRYESVPAPGPDDTARRRQIEAAIDGLTPYGLSELVYDWVIEDGHALVVVAALETLAEAEEFAAEHGFNPISFVAMPDAGQFLGEPYFGATRHAARVLPEGARVLPDAEPVQVVGRARIPAAQTVPAATRPAPAGGPSEPAPAPADADAMAAAPAPAPAPAEEPATGRSSAPDADSAERTTTAPPATPPVPDPRKRVGGANVSGREPSGGSATAPARPGLLPAGLRRPGQPAADAGKVAAGAGAASLMRRLGNRLRRDAPAAAAASEVAPPPAAAEPAGEPPAEAGAPTFASRRKPAPVSSRTNGGRAGDGDAVTSNGRQAAAERGRARGAVARMGEAVRRQLRRPDRKGPVPATGRNAAAGATIASGQAASKPTADVAVAAAARKPAVSFDRAPPRPAATEAIVPASRPPSSELEKAREAEALTIFGARSGNARRGDGARRGLVLAGGILLLVVALGAWLAYFAPASDGDVAATSEPPTAEAPADQVAAPPPAAETTPPADTAEAPPPAIDDTTAPPEEVAAAPDADARLEALVEEALSPAEPAEQFAGPEITDTFDPGEATAGAPPETAAMPPERLALPGPLERPAVDVPALISLPPPPPFGTEMQLGEDGLIIATPEGALTPEGVPVFARPPSEVPPARPALTPPSPEAAPGPELPAEDDASAADAVGPAADDAAQLPEPGLEQQAAPRAATALADFRPLARPRVASIPGEEVDEAALAAVSAEPEAGRIDPAPGGLALDALRPNPRPDSLVPSTAATDAEPAVAPELDLSSATPQAVVRSMLPNARPQDFSAAVQRALAAAARRQTETSRTEPSQPRQAAPAQTAQPQTAQPQPAQPQAPTAAAQPRIPTSASVAETATTRRAINLRRVNLIGVFGAQSNRRALVRMPNGQVVRVQVGDALDGGRVSAIGDGELRYVRGGRNQILRIGQSG